ncbi:serine hydrolase [Pseudomonas aeruginosa]|nr:serine hydrolase [Pseudomonas aeruginosa]HCT4810489.1 serine hydrolase [Pseudomonas aeruginosa]
MINKRNAIFLSMILIFFSIACIGSAGVRVWNFYTLFDSGKIAENFRAMPRLFNSVPIKKSGAAHFFEKNLRDMPGSFSFQGHEIGFKDWLASSNTTGLIVLSDDRIAFEEYYLGNSAKSLAIGWSLSKSLMSLLIGMAVDEGSIHSLLDPVNLYAPQLSAGGYAGVSLRDVLEMSSGIAFSEDYGNSDSDINQLGRTIALGGSVNEKVSSLRREDAPGRVHHYVSVDTQVLGMVLLGATGMGPSQFMNQRLWPQLGAECEGAWLTDDRGTELAFGGVNLCLRDFARIGLLFLHGGRSLTGSQIVSAEWVKASSKPRSAHLRPGRYIEDGEPNLGYGYQWWIPEGKEGEFLAIGVYGQFIYVNPLRRVVIAKTSAYVDYNVDGIRMEHEALAAFRAISRTVGVR